ncbi:MAG TPA: hypothetical protein VF642_12210 [Propionibacteriaceae bacterium]
MNPDVILANGGIAGLILALVAVGKLAKDWWRDRHDITNRDELQELTKGSTAVADASAANAVILASLNDMRTENARLTRKVETLELQNTAKDKKIRDLESKLADALDQIHDIAAELAALKTT